MINNLFQLSLLYFGAGLCSGLAAGLLSLKEEVEE